MHDEILRKALDIARGQPRTQKNTQKNTHAATGGRKLLVDWKPGQDRKAEVTCSTCPPLVQAADVDFKEACKYLVL